MINNLKSDSKDKALYETRLALYMLIKSFKLISKTPEQQKFYDASNMVLLKHFNITDILRSESSAVAGDTKTPLKELINIRNKLYEELPVGDNIDAFELLQMIKWHLNDIDNFCFNFSSVLENKEKTDV